MSGEVKEGRFATRSGAPNRSTRGRAFPLASLPLVWALALSAITFFSLLGPVKSATDGPTSLGHISTPRGNSASAWNRTYIAIALYEQLSSEVEVDVIERGTGALRNIVLQNSSIVYSMVFDRSEPDILWVVTSQRAALFKIRVSSGEITPIASFGDTKFIFAVAQHPSGDIYLGTYPDAKIYRLSEQAGDYKTAEITSLRELVGSRTNVKNIFTPGTGFVFFHVGPPGTLIAYDPVTGKSDTILNTTELFFLPARELIAPISSVKSLADFKRLPPGGVAKGAAVPHWAEQLLPRRIFSLKVSGFELIVTQDGRETHLSDSPRQGGMSISAYRKVSDDVAVGATYWNQWLFKVDLRSGHATPLGPIGRTGEFFTACGFEGKVIIPHYLGLLLSWDLNSPLQAPKEVSPDAPTGTISDLPGDNPRELLARPDGHAGLDCLDAGGGKLIYSMLPRYAQETGQLSLVDVAKGDEGRPKIEVTRQPPQTIDRLALSDGKLFAGTGEYRGLGLRPLANPPPLRILELDPTSLNEVRSVELPVDKYRYTTGLIALARHRLLVGTEGGGLYLVDTSTDALRARRIGQADCSGVSALASLSADTAVALCGPIVFVVDGHSGHMAQAAKLSGNASFVAVCPNGDVIVTVQSELFRIPATDIRKASAAVTSIAGLGTPISDGAVDGYPLRNILTNDTAAWISPLSDLAAAGHAFVGVDLEDTREEVIGADVGWALPQNTPTHVRFEYSDDGLTWAQAATLPTKPAPSSSPFWINHFGWRSVGAHRIWRMKALEGLNGNFAVEYLAFKRAGSDGDSNDPSADVQRASPIPSLIVDLGSAIGDGALDGYPLRNILTNDAAAWISPLSGSAAIGHAFAGMDFNDTPEEVVGADVDWVLPSNTPRRVRFEYSDDGMAWARAATRSTAPAPGKPPFWSDHFAWHSVGVHRFWRMTALDGLSENYAVQYLAFKRSGGLAEVIPPSPKTREVTGVTVPIVGLGTPIGDGALDGYALRNIMAGDKAVWISPLSGRAAIEHAYVGMDFEAGPEEIVGADVDWVLPENTPSRVSFDYSDDGIAWTQATSLQTSPAPSSSPLWLDHFTWPSVGAHRYWRMRPLENLGKYFAVECLYFKRPDSAD